MKAITVKYLCPTNVRGARIKAHDMDGNQVTIPYPHQLSGLDVYHAAAQALMEKMGWTGKLTGGQTASCVYVFVLERAT